MSVTPTIGSEQSVAPTAETVEGAVPSTNIDDGELSISDVPRNSTSTVYSSYSGLGSLQSISTVVSVDKAPAGEAPTDEEPQEIIPPTSKTEGDVVPVQEDKEQPAEEQQETVSTSTQPEQIPQQDVEATEGTDEVELERESVMVVELVNESDSINTNFAFMEDDEDVVHDDLTQYIMVEEVVMDDLGKEVKVKQKVPIIRETRHYERVSIPGGEIEEGKTHKFLETITRVIKTSALNEEGEVEDKETELTEIIEHDERPYAVTVYAKRKNEKGEMEEVIIPLEEIPVEPPEESEELRIKRELQIKRKQEREKEREKEKVDEKRKMEKKKILKMVKQVEVEPCSYGKLKEVLKPTMAEVEVEVDESEIEEDDLEEEDVHEEILQRREAKIARLKDNLRTVLVRLALAEKKRNLYMQLISISSEVKEDILNPPDPDKPSFKVPKKVKVEDKFRRMYVEKLMEYRELRSVILVKLAMEKKRKQEVKQKYDVIALEVAQLRKSLEDKLAEALSKLLPKNDPVFKNQSPQAMVKRVMELMERLDNETKELMYKKKQMYLAKQKYDELTENEMGLSYKYALASKELKELVSKNDRRNEKLESLKTTMQKESMAVTHINQKCEAILKTTDEKNSRLLFLNQSLIRARQDRKDVHQARRKVETELKQENLRIKQKNHPSLLREYQLVQDLLKAKQTEFQQLKKECLSSLEHMKKMTGTNQTVLSPRLSDVSATLRSPISPAKHSSQ